MMFRAGGRGLRGQPGPGARIRPHLPAPMPITSRTPRRRPCASPAPRAPIHTPVLPQASRPCGDPPTAAPMKRCSTCLPRSERRTISTSSSTGQKTRTTRFGSWDSDIACTRTTIPGPGSCSRPAARCWTNSAWRTTPRCRWRSGWRRSRWKTSILSTRRLYPNVDFYSGIILRAMGIPEDMFTVIFAHGTHPGMDRATGARLVAVPYKIGRPRQLYTGAPRRDFVPIEKR